MVEYVTHERLALLPCRGIGIIALLHGKQGLAAYSQAARAVASLHFHRPALDLVAILFFRIDGLAARDVMMEGQGITQFLQQPLFEAAEYGDVVVMTAQCRKGIPVVDK